jgi:hypothetical protein
MLPQNANRSAAVVSLGHLTAGNFGRIMAATWRGRFFEGCANLHS